MKHTPGPWEVKESNRFTSLYITSRDGRIATTYGEGDYYNTQWPNARLIAAAPELLEACKRAYDAIASLPIDCMGDGQDGELIWPIRDEVLYNITAAIAKAKGES